MPPDPVETNKPKETPEVKAQTTVEHLEELRKEISEEKINGAIDALIVSMQKNGGDVPQSAIDKFIEDLDTREEEIIFKILIRTTFRGKLSHLRERLDPNKRDGVHEKTSGSEMANNIIDTIRTVVVEKKIGDLSTIAASFGFKGVLGDQSNFVVAKLVGAVARITESLMPMLKGFDTSNSIAEIALALRIASHIPPMTVKEQELYEKDYRELLGKTGSSFVPPTLAQAQKRERGKQALTLKAAEKPAKDKPLVASSDKGNGSDKAAT